MSKRMASLFPLLSLALITGLLLGYALALVGVPGMEAPVTRDGKHDVSLPSSTAERVWRERLPSTPIASVRLQPGFEQGLFELVAGNRVLYGDASGKYLVFGHVYELSSNTDLTQQVIDSLDKGETP